MIKKTFKILAWTTGLLLFLAVSTVTEVDWTDPKTKAYYQETMKDLDELQAMSSEGTTWLAGWAQINVTPKAPVDLVGYKPRGEYEFVLDSSFVKALVIGNGKRNVAYLNYELLIIHPFLAKNIEKAIKAAQLPIDKVYFTGTHTHSGMGGYMPGIMGKIAFGGYDEAIVEMLAERSVIGLTQAFASQDTAQITYQKYPAPQFVSNRFIKNGPTDPYIRQLVLTKDKGQRGTFFTYTAHATCLSSRFLGLSGDYPYYLTEDMLDDYDFALFAAGTVGSHKPMAPGRAPENIKAYAYQIDSLMERGPAYTEFVDNHNLRIATFKPQLPEATYRISDNFRLRPWLFNSLFGDTNSHFDIIQIGNVLMISSSGEISGMFYKEWEKLAEEKDLHLIITTFNGGYMGYIVPDRYYNEKYFEARDMNWFGPYSGSFFDKIITKIISSAK